MCPGWGGGCVVAVGRGRGPSMMGAATHAIREISTCLRLSSIGPDLTTFLGLDALGLTAVGQYLTAKRAVIECRMPIGFEDPFCKACGAQGQARGTVARCLAHVPVGWRPTQLVVRVRRFACTHCRRVWRQDTSGLAEPRARLTRSAVEWGLRALALECMSVSRVAAALGISWHTANNAILTSAQATLLDDPHRFDGVEVLGVDEHVWRHTRRGDRYVTVIIDLTPVRDRSGPARLHRVQERRRRGAPTGPGGHGPLPRRMTTSTSPTARATAEKITPPLTFCSRLWRCSILKESSWRESCWVTVLLGSNCWHHLQRGRSRDLEIVTILSQKSMYG